MSDTVVSDIFCFLFLKGKHSRQIVKDGRHQVCGEMAYSEFVAYKQHFDSRGCENVWAGVCEMPVAGHMFFSTLVVYSQLLCRNIPVLVSMETKKVWRS